MERLRRVLPHRAALLRVFLVACGAALVWTSFFGAALAAPPLSLDPGLVTDDAGVLGSDTEAMDEALERLESEHGVQLFVVFVRSFDGMDSNDWADETASINGLGVKDVLIAVAVADGQYAWSVDSDFPLTDSQLAAIASDDIEPKLRDEEWAGAVTAAADGFRTTLDEAADEGAGASTSNGSGGSSPWACLIPGGLLAAGGGVAAFFASRRKKRGGGTGPAGEPSTKELETTAGKLLVEVDDALRTSEQELGFAEAEFGAAAIDEFRSALEESRRDAAEAFRLQQQLYDSEPKADADRRNLLKKIIELAGTADARLDEKAESFSRLRNLAGRADEVLAAVTTRLDRVEAELPKTRDALAALKKAYLADALGEVADDDEEAAALVAAAREAIAKGTDAIAKGDRNAAALSARAAEEGAATAEQLLTAVATTGDQLKAAQTALADEAAKLETAASQIGGGAHADLVASAREAVAGARAALASPPLDPPAHLAKIREVAGKVDAVLAEARDEAERAAAARSSANATMSTARDRIVTAESFISTRARAVDAQARSSLVESRSRLAQAVQLITADPAAALAAAQAAQQYAESALRYARGDVAASGGTVAPAAGRAESSHRPPAAWMSGGASAGSSFGGSSSRRTGGGSSAASRSASSSSGSRRTSGNRSSSGRRGGKGRF